MSQWKGKRIGVVMGGLSSERDVSLNTGRGVAKALRDRGHDVVDIDWREGTSLPALLADARVEVVWNALHGTFGEDGAVQGLLACLGIPGTGSGILASALAMDKVASKRLFESHRVPTPTWRVFDPAWKTPEAVAAAVASWPVPIVVKPAREGSSVGVSIVRDHGGVAAAVALARSHRGPTIIEHFIAGKELHVGVLDGAVLGSVEVRPSSEFYDYAAKYQRGDTQYLVPAPLPADVAERAHAVALEAYRALGCSGHGRVDLRLAEDGKPFVLEVNTLPGMTGTSLLPKIAAHAGIDYASLCERILETAA
jgi:D-alanine-D-alanine ligase